MKILIFLFSIFLLFFSCSSKQELTKESENQMLLKNLTNNAVIEKPADAFVQKNKKSRLLILLLENQSSKKKYPNSDLVRTIIFNGIYTFIGIIPDFNVPDKNELLILDPEKQKLEDLISNNNADIVIYGIYKLSGKPSRPDASIKLNIWSGISRTTLSYNYKTPTDVEIFDTIDRMIAKIVKVTLNEELRTAVINFGGFKTGDSLNALYVNEKLLGVISNDGFSMNLKIMPNSPYNIVIKRLSDNAEIVKTNIILKPDKSAAVGYKAEAVIRCELINKDPSAAYKILLDGKTIPGDQDISNIPAWRSHIVKVIDDNGKELNKASLYLKDGEYKSLSISAKPLSEGLFLYLPFSGNANDESGNGHNGTVYNAVLTNDRFGTPNSAYYFDGGKAFIQLNEISELNVSFTITAWINYSVFKLWSRIFDFSNGEGNDEITFGNMSSSSVLYFSELYSTALNNTINHNISTSQPIDSMRWYFICITCTDQGEVVIMIDNKMSKKGKLMPLKSVIRKSNYIGRSNWAQDDFFKGYIDDMRIYKRLLTEDEISALYHEGGWK